MQSDNLPTRNLNLHQSYNRQYRSKGRKLSSVFLHAIISNLEKLGGYLVKQRIH